MLGHNDFMELVERILTVKSLEDAQKTLDVLRATLGLERFLYGVTLPSGMIASSTLVISNYDQAWMQRYVEQDYFHVDPVIRHCLSSMLPYMWDRLREDEANPTINRFVSEAQDFGLTAGISLGLRGRAGQDAVMSVATSSNSTLTHRELKHATPLVCTLLPYIYESLYPLVVGEVTGTINPDLSKRERECLSWSAEGLTAQQIADRLCVSTPTVNFHLKNAADKLGVRNRSQAVARALLIGAIKPARLASPTYRILQTG